jgi:ribonuclease P protein component
MKRSHRLRRSGEIQTVRRVGRRVSHPLATLWYHRRSADFATAAPESRFCFTASRRVGNAVQRNRAKRLLREAVRQHLDAIVTPFDGVLAAREGTASADFAAVEAAVLFLLRQAGVISRSAPPTRPAPRPA